MRRNSLAHVARGADGVLFFQWRQSRAGSEKFHSAMVPHAGTRTKVWREVVSLGDELRRIAEVKGSRVDAEVALLWDWEAWWAVELDSHPSADLSYLELVRDHHAALWRRAVAAEVLARYADGPVAGGAAVTRNRSAWYVSTRLGPADLGRLLARVCDHAGVAPVCGSAPPPGVEVVRRR